MNFFLVKIYGIVQGVGFRPFIARLFADAHGSVKNCGSFVELHLCTDDGEKLYHLRELAPPRADIVDVDIKEISEDTYKKLQAEDIPEKGEEGKNFFIAKSPEEKPADAPVFIPPDLAICDDCAKELYDPQNRRYLHPFINCTQCGPRLTIIDSLPYDRPRTSMKDFPMCDSCEEEYTNPSDRRYDAQPVCCNECGPSVYFLKGDEVMSRDGDAITEARQALINGEIIAVKGIGGFHLYCDAADENAVLELRRRKGRPAKPFAVMAKDLETAENICDVPEEAVSLLTGPKKPIVLMPKKAVLPEALAPGNPSLGVMLPYAPLQLLLFAYPDGLDDEMPQVLVATSANRSGGVICRTEEEVEKTLGGVIDGILSHDREILTRADDSVVDFFEGKPYMIRRSRGYAPLPIVVRRSGTEHFEFKVQSSEFEDRSLEHGIKSSESGDVLAFGGELKNTFCVKNGNLLYLSPYIGDLSDLGSDRALEETVARFLKMLDAHPAVVICDKHPSYRSHALAKKYVLEHPGTKLVTVQHHYAHVLSVMAENHFYGKVIGVAYDGTGYGDDGTIWGGEIFLCDCRSYERVSHIAPFIFSGGDVAAREGFRVALSMLFDKYENVDEICDIIKKLDLCEKKYVRPLKAMHDMGINSVKSTSCGRLFDAVSAVIGICRKQSFEGEASMGLQFAAERGGCGVRGERKRGDRSEVGEEEDDTIRTDELFYRIVEERMKGGSAEELAYMFHEELARMTADEAVKIREKSGVNTVALSGGCFQNTLLLGLTKSALEQSGFQVLTAHEVPPNDGGLSLGQAEAVV